MTRKHRRERIDTDIGFAPAPDHTLIDSTTTTATGAGGGGGA